VEFDKIHSITAKNILFRLKQIQKILIIMINGVPNIATIDEQVVNFAELCPNFQKTFC